MKRILVIISIFSLMPTATLAQGSLCESHMIRAAQKHSVPIGILYAVGLTETGRRGSLHPHALNADGKSYYPENQETAISRFIELSRGGARNIDIGCMQISYRYHAKQFGSLAEMFDPALNVTYAAVFLKRLRAREGNWTKAVARYHAGPRNRAAHKRYVCRVIANMFATGFAAWTEQSRRICQD